MTRIYTSDKIDSRTTQVVLKIYDNREVQAVISALFRASELSSLNVSVLSFGYGCSVNTDVNQFITRAYAIVNGFATPELCEVHDSIF